MQTIVAVVSIVVEKEESVEQLNALCMSSANT